MEDAVCDGHRGLIFERFKFLQNLIILQNFRFKTRVQRLNNIEASSRAKLNFLEQLYQFHKQQGNPRVVVPTINHKPLDLWLLRKEVHKLGGYDAVSPYHLSYGMTRSELKMDLTGHQRQEMV